MRKWMVLAAAACLLLVGCEKKEDIQTEKKRPDTQQEQTQDVPEQTTQPEESPDIPDDGGWRVAYAAFLEAAAVEVERLQDPGRADYDPNWVQADIAETIGSYFLYDIDKNGVPELLMRYGAGEAGYHTTVYGYTDRVVTELGDIASGHAAFYTWPGENAVAMNWGHMGGNLITKISLADGKLSEELIFEEFIDGPDMEYTAVTDIVPGALPLREAYPTVTLPEYGALTLPVYHYGTRSAKQELVPARDARAKADIERVLTGGGAFFGVTADGFGGDTGWITMEEYLRPGGMTEYAESDLSVTAREWLDLNNDGKSEALVTIEHAEGDPYGGTTMVVFSLEEDGNVYAYCMNYMGSYEVQGTVFINKYDRSETTIAFDLAQAYLFTPGQEMP